MRTSCFSALLWAVGCAAPDPIDFGDALEPRVQILFPTPEDPQLPLEVELTEDCFLRQLVVVDIDGIELTQPETPDATESQGHMHIAFDPTDYDAVYTEAHDFIRGPLTSTSSYASQGIKTLRVTLQANDHADLDQYEFWDSVVEYKIVDNHGCFQ
jgi:hypothetical protein